MSRWTGLAVAALAVASAVGASAARAGTDEQEGRHADRTSRVVRVGHGGAHLGVATADVSAEDVKRLGLPAERGALVRHVGEDSPASKAGLKTGDVIVAFEGETVRSAAHLSRLVRETPPGRTVALTVVRGGARQDLRATLEEMRPGRMLEGLQDLRIEGLDNLKIEGLDKLRERMGELEIPEPPEPPEPPEVPEPPEPPSMPFADHWGGWPLFGTRPPLGIQVVDLTDQLARYFKVDDGVLVSSVRAGSPAEKAGLRAGDVIVKVDGQPVGSSRDLERRVGRVDSEREVALSVQREGRAMDLRVRLLPRARRAPNGPTT